MHLVYWQHARTRMSQRNISHAEVVACLEHWDVKVPGNKPGRVVFMATVFGRRLKVVTMQDSEPPIVVSVMVEGE